MVGELSGVLTQIISWLGQVVDSLMPEGALHAILPLVLLGIAGSVVMFGAKIIRMFAWGN